ncbi:MAG TPA: transcription antitermination factor NusB [Burkholderiaceae bacterium]|nr:transcription antitermination factor NusB [Burkholderiaceae bacterium]
MAAKTPNEAPAAAPGPTPAGSRRARRQARSLALQGLYGWLLAGGEAEDIAKRLLTAEQLAKVDVTFFRELLGGTIGAARELREEFVGLVDRPVAALSPIEHALLLMGAYELKHCPQVPYKVAINEAIELAKTFGGTDGFRYVNGVMDKLAARLRGAEVRAAERGAA